LDRRLLLAAVAVLTLAAVGGAQPVPAAVPVAARAASHDVIVTEAGARIALVGCTIRNTGAGWYILDNSGHTPSNCTGLVQHADHLELQHNVGAVRVITAQVTPDETYSQADVRAGVSAGFGYSNIFLFSGAPGSPPLNPAGVVALNGNFWFQGYFLVSTSSGR
jgi:hypothetical protein